MSKLIFENEEDLKHFETVVGCGVRKAMKANADIIADASERGALKAVSQFERRIGWVEDWMWKVQLSPRYSICIVTLIVFILMAVVATAVI